MSWNNVLPYYFWEVEHEVRIAKSLGAFEEELDAGFMRSLPDFIVALIKEMHWNDTTI